MTSPSRRARHVPLATLLQQPHTLHITLGIQSRILLPLLVLMLVSLLGSTLGFVFSTNATRNQIIDEQLADDSRRLTDAWRRREQELSESVGLLANDTQMITALQRDATTPESAAVLALDQRAVVVRDRFQLDQVLVLNRQAQPRVNIVTRSALSQLDLTRPIQDAPSDGQPRLVRVADTWLLLSVARVRSLTGTVAPGTIVAAIDVSAELTRLRRELELSSDIQLALDTVLAATTPTLQTALLAPERRDAQIGNASYRVATTPLTLGATSVRLALLRSEEAINTIVSTGLQVMLISSGLTLLLVMAIGIVLARSLTRPVRKLARVAQAVAAGDLSQRANLSGYDEIGQLGQTLDHATTTIARLLDQQAQHVGELHAIMHSIADGVLAVDAEERIIIVNPVAGALLARPRETLIGRRLATLLLGESAPDPDGMQQIVALIRSELPERPAAPGSPASAPGQPPPDAPVPLFKTAAHLRAADVSEERVALGERIVQLRSAPIVGGEGVRLGAVVVLQDVTEAIAIDRAKTDFIAIASHELRTPLTGIKGHVDLLGLLNTNNLRAEQLDSVRTIQRQTNHMITLVNDLLEVARFEQGSEVQKRALLEPAAVIESIVGEHQHTLAQRHLTLVQELEAELPLLEMNFLHVRRILSNLASNAIKYTPDGGSITVRAYELSDPARLPSATDMAWPHATARSVVFEVEDTGVGIRAVDQPRIFARFFRSPNARSVEAGGTGLGLTIVRALVQMNGGQIGFRSAPGQGSCFWVRFPTALDADALVLPRGTNSYASSLVTLMHREQGS